MALGKYSRVDGRKSSSYCSTVTIVVFVALCLVGVWMMTSSSVVPVQNSDVSSQGKNSDAATQVSGSKESYNGGNESNNNAGDESNPTDEGKSKQFEDNPGDLPEDATKGDASVSQEENSSNSQRTESTTEVKQEEKSTEQNEDTGDSKSETQSESGTDNSDDKKMEDKDSEAGEKNENKSVGEETEEGSDEKKSVENPGELNEKKDQEVDQGSDEKADGQKKDQSSNEVFPSGAQSDLLNETTTQNGAFSTQASESKNEKETQKSPESDKESRYTWKVCNSTAGPDYIPCLDNLEAIRSLRSTKHYEHRERHCPDNPPTCLVPLPEGYQRSVEWPTSREKVIHYFYNAV